MKTSFSLCVVIAFLLVCQVFASVFGTDIPGDGDVSCYPRSTCLSMYPALATWAGTVASPALVSGGTLVVGGSTLGLQIATSPVTLTFSDPPPANPDPSGIVGPLGFNKLFNPVKIAPNYTDARRDNTIPISGQQLTLNIKNTASIPLTEIDFYLQSMAAVLPNGQADGMTFGVYCTGLPDSSQCSPSNTPQNIKLLMTPTGPGTLNPADTSPTNNPTFGDLLRFTGVNLAPNATGTFSFYVTDYNGTRLPSTNGTAPKATFTLQIVPIPVPTYTISGQVTLAASGQSGVTLFLSGNATTSMQTDTSGNYSFTGLAPGNYIVTPSKPGYNFAPLSQTFNNLNANVTANFTATIAMYSITGKVTNAGNGQSGVTVTLSGSTSNSTMTDGSGNYSFTGLVLGNYTVTPSKIGFTYTPLSQTFNNMSASQTANFATGVPIYTISGQVTLSGSGLSGVAVALSGSAINSTLTDSSGNYSFTSLLAGNYTLTPSKTGYSFTPPSTTFNALSANQTANFTATFGITMSLSQTTLNFGVNGLLVTSPQAVALSFTAGADVSWTTSACPPNLIVNPNSGHGNTNIQVTASSGPGCTVTISSFAAGVNNSPIQLRINVNSVANGPPYGFYDIPLDNTTGVSGAIAVGGWALDGVEVTDVSIWREPVGSEPGGKLIFIGTATLVSGARPDVQAVSPGVPFNYRAGWGYALLTNFLPNSSGPGTGNGAYKLHVIVTDKAGLTTDLGAHTITTDNAHAMKPFGTIDTPAQGGTVSGSAYVNFAWALTPQPYIIPTNGSTLTVIIDGQPVGQPTYNQFRSDIATLFPGYMNSNGAVGYYFLDTTKLANGGHTISWNAFDSGNRGEGLGSRYFNVANAASGIAAPQEPPAESARLDTALPEPSFTRNLPATSATRDDNGNLLADMPVMGRIEIEVGGSEGYMLVNGERQPLPIGSSLKDGVFYWLAGPGFLGEYQLVFERPDSSSVQLKVTIRPKQFEQ